MAGRVGWQFHTRRSATMDKYDEAIAYLTENPERIVAAWSLAGRGGLIMGEDLFLPVSPLGSSVEPDFDGRGNCGCLTQIRSGDYNARTRELTESIRADYRIPRSGWAITVEHLPVFAEWQRKIDAMLNRN